MHDLLFRLQDFYSDYYSARIVEDFALGESQDGARGYGHSLVQPQPPKPNPS